MSVIKGILMTYITGLRLLTTFFSEWLVWMCGGDFMVITRGALLPGTGLFDLTW
jgi:hypothetical protein